MSFPFVFDIDGVGGIEGDLTFNMDVAGCSIYKEGGSAILVLGRFASCRVEESASVYGN